MPAPPREDVASWARRRQREAEEALGPEGRIRLALTLGLRARALGAQCASLRLDRKFARVLDNLAAAPDDEPLP